MTARSNAGWTVAGRPGRRLIAALLLGLMALVSACSAGASSGVRPVVTRTPVSTTPPGDSPLNQAHPARAAPLRVELWGDSLAEQAADYIRYFFEVGGGVTVKIRAFGGTAVCDWLADIRTELDPVNPKAFHPQAAVLEFNGDAGTPCTIDLAGNRLTGQDLVRKYLADSMSAIDICTQANVPIYFVTNPLDSVTQWAFSGFTQIEALLLPAPRIASGRRPGALDRCGDGAGMEGPVHVHVAVSGVGDVYRKLAGRHENRDRAAGRRSALLPGHRVRDGVRRASLPRAHAGRHALRDGHLRAGAT